MNFNKEFIDLRERFGIEEKNLEQESKKAIESSFRIDEKIQVTHRAIWLKIITSRTNTGYLKAVKDKRIIIVEEKEGFPQNIPFRDIEKIISVE